MERESSETSRDFVVLIHGLGSHRWLMLPLKWKLKRSGFEARNFGYRSFFHSIPQHAHDLQHTAERLDRDPSVDRWHIVAHSMGSVITRQLLENRSWQNLHRIVMLAPPNHGSPAARRLSYLFPWSESVRQISDVPDSYVRQLGPERPIPGIEIGVIAASYDFVVSDKSSQLPFEHSRTKIFSGHNGLLIRPRAAEAILRFLKTGCFDDDADVSAAGR